MSNSIKAFHQLDSMDCGPTCLRIIAHYYGLSISLERVRALCDKGRQGVTLLGIQQAAKNLGFDTLPLKVSADTFIKQAQFPCIVHWQGNHFVVVYKVSGKYVYIADPAQGKVKYKHAEFIEHFCPNGREGIALFFQCPQSLDKTLQSEDKQTNGLLHLLGYLGRFKRFLLQLGIGAMVGTIVNLIFPFLTQALVDHGINNQDIDFVYAVLAAQLMLFFSRTTVEFIRGWILVHMGTRINVAVVSAFLQKLMRLPLSFFSRKNLGDVLQRIADHQKIEEFLTSHTISIVFSVLNLLVFSAVMAMYSFTIFLVFICGSLLSIFWVTLFLKRRKTLDHQHFQQMSDNQNYIVQVVAGMPEIKINDCTLSRRWAWENIQGKLFKTKIAALAIEQYQQGGSLFFNEGKNILITFIAAGLVISGEMTLGMMLAISYILGQMNAPIEQLLLFIRQAQDAKLSMERLAEVQNMPDENELNEAVPVSQVKAGDIRFSHVDFKYSVHDKNWVLQELDFTIEYQKTTAIVGASGSGKTTLLKLLLKFFSDYNGKISVEGQDLAYICPDAWRRQCGVVLQEGYIFSDTVAANIALGNELPDMERVMHAAKTANIHEEIENLPQGYYTRIGADGMGLSGGQIQRILIARAVYKRPEYIFLDEATSALDAHNEKLIQENLNYFFKGRTVLVIAHRLSTVKHADQIIVLDKGKIVEQGTHKSLSQKRGYYYELVKNQLELGR